MKSRAKLLGVSHHPSIGLENLQKKIDEHLAAKEAEDAAKAEPPPQPNQAMGTPEGEVHYKRPQDSKNMLLAKARKEAMLLKRVNISCTNPIKAKWHGEIFTFSNKMITVKKFVPFNVDTHVPYCIYEMIKNRQYRITVQPKRGEKGIQTNRLVPEFAIRDLNPLTKEELDHLAAQQLARKTGTED